MTRGLLRQFIHYGTASAVPAVLSLAFTGVFTRALSAGEFGRYSLVTGIVGLAAAVGGQWIQQGVGRYLPGQGSSGVQRIHGATAVALWVSTAGLLACGAGGVLAARWLLSAEWQALAIPGVAVALGWCPVNALGVVLQSSMRAGRYSLYRVTQSGTRFFAAVVIVFLIWRHPAALLWGEAASLGLVLPFLWRDAGLPGSREVWSAWRDYVPTLRTLARYGFPMVGYSLATVVLDVSDRYIIQLFRGSDEVGIYAANYGLIQGGVVLAAAPALLAAHPLLMRAWERGQRLETARWIGTIADSLAVIGIVCTVVLWLLGREIAELLLGPAFRAGHIIMPPVFAGIVVWQLSMYTHKPLEFGGKTGVMLWASVLVAAVNVGLNLLLVPAFGYVAAAYTTLASCLLYVGITFQLGQRELRWQMNPRPIAIGAVLAAGLAALGAGAAGVLEDTLGRDAATAVKVLVAGGMLAALGRWLSRQLPSGFRPSEAEQTTLRPEAG